MNQVDESGRCPLHPSMQLRSLKKNGEWRVLMNNCPLCVSGLPAEGQSISIRTPPVNDSNSAPRDNARSRRRGEDDVPPKGRMRAPPQQQVSLVQAVTSYDSGATTEDESVDDNQNVYEEFNSFLKADQQKMGMAPIPSMNNCNENGLMPHRNKQDHSPSEDNEGPMPPPQQSMQQRFPPPPQPPHLNPKQPKQSKSRVSTQQPRRPDPESTGNQPPPNRQKPRKKSPKPQQMPVQKQMRSHQNQPQTTPQKQQIEPDEVSLSSVSRNATRTQQYPLYPMGAVEADERSVNSASRLYQNRAIEPDEVSVSSMTRDLYNMSASQKQHSPYQQMNEYGDEQIEPDEVSVNSVSRNKYMSAPQKHHSPYQQMNEYEADSIEPDEVSVNSMTRNLYMSAPQKHHSPYQQMNEYGDELIEPYEVSVNSMTRNKYKVPMDPDEVSINSSSSRRSNRYRTPPRHHSPYPPTEQHEAYKPDPDEVSHNSALRKSTPPKQYSPYNATQDYGPPKPLDQDEVSAVSMNSVTRHIRKKKLSGTNTASEKDYDEDEPSLSSEEKISAATAQYDPKGKCIRHPTVRLRKKKLFGGWTILLSNCPECCLDEMRKVKEDRSTRSKGGGSSRCGSEGNKSKSSTRKKHKQRKDKKNPPMSQVNISSSTPEDDKSIGTASTITISSYTLSSAGRPRNWQDFTNDEETGPACVTRMPYTDNAGDKGWYTGAVDGKTGIPHGFGTMNFSDGRVFEGQWKNGVSVITSEGEEGNSPAKARYPRGVTRRTFALETHFEDGSRSTRSRSRSNSRSRVPPQQQTPSMVIQQQQRKVVCGMSWTDSAGSGVYTGEVNSLNIPDGVGSMRYHAGIVSEGLWRDGEIENDVGDDGM